jgi:hypothetical protein
MSTFCCGRGAAWGTTDNSPASKWTAFNAIAEHLDCGWRYTSATNQVQRSFEGHWGRGHLAVPWLNLRCVRV